ncbi:KTSC domain-containing protein [Flavobacterium agricola]|uniref:KTSC domain-containing protein n=1 Tax=Flavobacterium agricola TaxID=2870839 RepID=A0ABY6M3E0_9FLAO|nr:KTSC domain-containing protein [Flavobacterium agricola]UYW01508.1 KTSC domain-containing protein [Flavobacterium agricola]
MKKILFIFVLAFCILSCGKKGCESLQSKYESQPEAVKEIRTADFALKDVLTTANSSSIKRIEYYSCDGNQGYLIVYNLSGDVKLHRDVPVSIWEGLKSSEFMRNYYNDNIKDEYPY